MERVHAKDIYDFIHHVTKYFNDKNSEREENNTSCCLLTTYMWIIL
jgi:hypothetical protein